VSGATRAPRQSVRSSRGARYLALTRYDERGWRATFYTTGMEHSPTSATGTAWERTPWDATQRAAREALKKAENMNVTLLKALLALVPTGLLFSGSVVLISRERTVWSFLQLVGAVCLVIVALTHLSEALDMFPWMHWGREDSLGHYLDLSSAVLGLTLFPAGYLLHALHATRLTMGA
jgi:hypothetical protein